MAGRLTAVSLFSGTGGFDYGAAQAGVDIVWANDIDPHASAAYRRLFPNVNFADGDVRDIDDFPRADILIGCYPCTGFSIAARRRWHDEEERNLRDNEGNFLYREFMRALRQVRPKYLFVENVKGMITAEDGWFLKRQLDGFRRHGYNVKHEMLHAQDFGVSQSRKRMFIVGVRDSRGALDYQFPEPTHGPHGNKPYVPMRSRIGQMNEWPEGEYFDYPFHGHYLTRQRKRTWDELSYTIVADAHHVPLHPSGEPMVFVRTDTWALQGKLNRRLSWRECARLQGLPAEAIPSGNLMDKYRVVGNAVPPALGRALLKPVVEFESRRLQRHSRRVRSG
jgi:DNA (cytosine-5)-methyltransferase 1